MTFPGIEPPFDIESIHAAWRTSDLNDGSPAIFYRRAIRSLRANRLSQKKSWPLDVAHPSANLVPTARYTTWLRRLWLDRGPRGWIPKCEKAVGLWREGSQKRTGGPILLDDQIDPHNISWLVQLAELIGDHYERGGNVQWARELYLDFLRSTNHLRTVAPLDQGRFACAVELRMAGELRRWAFAKKTTYDEIRNAINELRKIWLHPVPAAEHFRAEYALLAKNTKQTVPAQVSESCLPGIQTGLLWFWELAAETTASRTKLLRQQQQAGGTFAMLPLITKPFCKRYGLAAIGQVKEQLAHATVQTELARYTEAISYFDQCMAARAATLASLIVAAYQTEKGYYPQELATACNALSVASTREPMMEPSVPPPIQPHVEPPPHPRADPPLDPPLDPYSQHGEPIRYLRSPGQRLKGLGVEWRRQSVRTRTGQPIVYSLGADGEDHRCTTVWNRQLAGRGDWAFPLRATRVPRRWLQFDTRTVLTAFTLFALLFGLRVSPPGRHRAAVVTIEEMGGEIEYRESDESPSFVERWLGPEYGGKVISITLSEKKDLWRVAHLLPYLRETESLDLSSTTVSAADLDNIGRMSELTQLDLDSAVIKGGNLYRLSALGKLTNIDVSDTAANDLDLAALAKLKALTDIDASRSQVTGLGFAELAALPDLSRLIIIGAPITDDGLAGIGKLTGLTHLDLDSTTITGSGLMHLSGLTALETIDLRGTLVDDDGLKTFPPLPELQTIYLQNSQVKGPGLIGVAQLPNLTSISLGEIEFSENGLEYMADSQSLTSINLENCKLKKAGLPHLKSIKTLNSLDLNDAIVDQADIQLLRKSLPDLEIDQ